jgi:hypothetical protein
MTRSTSSPSSWAADGMLCRWISAVARSRLSALILVDDWCLWFRLFVARAMQ